ncbi:hypothetical protein A3Q56_00647 [Intoshia linei]|uniref:Kinesin-like protein n=1 Tax=Intoshia linei TaxID=1819745 RepID=A0A177BB88_9BILA|nr:hypothetical protein A3Q56_00647 [Intoshia linei]
MDKLKVSMDIDIKRSDGRVHAAKISHVNIADEYVTVEWIESGETKGKEVELVNILEMNEKIFSTNKKPDASTPHVDDDNQSTRSYYNNINKRHNTPITRQKSINDIRSVRQKNNRPSISRPKEPNKNTNRILSRIITKDLQHNRKDERKECNKNTAIARRSVASKENKILRNSKVASSVINEPVPFGPPEVITGFQAMIEDYVCRINMHNLVYLSSPADQKITVCIRKRPLNRKELLKSEIDVVTMHNERSLLIHEPKTKVDQTKYLDNHQFTFDYVFDQMSSNQLIYNYTAKPLLNVLFNGGTATCFAYGQTGSGKTHTMNGKFNKRSQVFEEDGIYTYAAKDLFEWLKPRPQCTEFMAGGAYFEIYGGKVFDLLNNRKKLRILEDGRGCMQLLGLKETYLKNVDDVTNLIETGARIRTSGQTSANLNSSRSHAIFQLILRRRTSRKLYGVFSLIDLAGNERGADTMSSDRQTRMEGAEINKSLLALKECIRALGRKNAHVPFRGSKLTLVLRDSFIGENSKTCMISTVSPGLTSCEHTLNTLRYANRVKELGPNDVEQNSDVVTLDECNDEVIDKNNSIVEDVLNDFLTAEEDVVDYHTNFITLSTEKINKLDKLLKVTEEMSYDVDSYCNMLDTFINDQAEMLNTFSACFPSRKVNVNFPVTENPPHTMTEPLPACHLKKNSDSCLILCQ